MTSPFVVMRQCMRKSMRMALRPVTQSISQLMPSWAVTPAGLPPGMVYSRPSIATQVNSDGSLGYGPHNLLTYSNDWSQAAWGVLGSATKTGSNVINLGATYATGVRQVVSIVAGSTVSVSVKLSGTPGATCYLAITDEVTFGGVAILVTLSATPTLYTVSRSVPNASCSIRVLDNGTATSVTLADAQLNVGTLQPYYPTTSAAYFGLRVADYSDSMAPVLGPELVTNGDFSSGLTGWTAQGGGSPQISVASGQLTLTNGSANEAGLVPTASIGVLAGRTYLVTLNVVSTAASAGPYFQVGGTYQQIFNAGAKSFTIVAASNGSMSVVTGVGNIGASVVVDNISVREITGYAGTRAGIKIEPQATNLLLNSDCRTQPYSVLGGSLTASVDATTLAPDGAAALKLVVTAQASIRFGDTSSGTPNATYTGSLYVRAATGGTVSLDINDQSATVTTVGEFWRRAVASGAINAAYRFLDVVLPVGTYWIFGSQLELGSVATSYIPTAGSTVARSADSLSWPVSAIPGFSGSRGVFVATAATNNFSGYPVLVDSTAASNVPDGPCLFAVYGGAQTAAQLPVAGSYANGNSLLSPRVASGIHKYGMTYSASLLQVSRDGALGNAVTPSATPSSTLSVFVGGSRINSDHVNGTIYDLRYYPQALPAATLQSLTA
jgi:hypothetical protein